MPKASGTVPLAPGEELIGFIWKGVALESSTPRQSGPAWPIGESR
jgi:hypothetical protein